MRKLRCPWAVPGRFYVAEHTAGELVYTHCMFFTNEDMPLGIRFSQSGIKITTYLRKRLLGKKYLEVLFNIPKGKTVKLSSTDAQIFWGENNQSSKAAFKTISLIGSPIYHMNNPTTKEHVLNINKPMVGESMKTWDKSFWLATYLDVPNADELSIIIPQFTVNEELITLPKLHFHKRWIILLANMIGMLQC